MFVADDNVIDITVEDPNESFQDLRDKHDVSYLISKNSLVKESPFTLNCWHIKEVVSQFKFCQVCYI
jgi:hypothetical protein